jgi:hypothetical protein
MLLDCRIFTMGRGTDAAAVLAAAGGAGTGASIVLRAVRFTMVVAVEAGDAALFVSTDRSLSPLAGWGDGAVKNLADNVNLPFVTTDADGDDLLLAVSGLFSLFFSTASMMSARIFCLKTDSRFGEKSAAAPGCRPAGLAATRTTPLLPKEFCRFNIAMASRSWAAGAGTDDDAALTLMLLINR